MRNIKLAQVVIKVLSCSRPCYLLRWNKKWKDWGVVGGHVEPYEIGHYMDTAVRECEEELSPLKYQNDFYLSPFPFPLTIWGPVPSKSNSNEPTEYTSKFFWLTFLKNEKKCLEKLPASDFILLNEKSIEKSKTPTDGVLRIIRKLLGGDLSRIPFASEENLRNTTIKIRI